MSDESRDPCSCHAFGCPMLGTMSNSTTGPKADWLCWIHFGADAGEWQQISAELNRVVWLAESVAILRHAYRGDYWHQAVKAARKRLIGAQRSDLMYGQGESAAQWIGRLEAELRRIARPVQQALTKLDAVAEQQEAETAL